MLNNYQRGIENSIRDRNGYLRMLIFDTNNDVMEVKTYSTWEENFIRMRPVIIPSILKQEL
ncbi:MAG: hypothetical protein ACP5D9_19625 [Mariniphaga sp.]